MSLFTSHLPFISFCTTIQYVVNYDLPLALSLDDVLLVPQYSEIKSRSEVDLSTVISKNLKLKIPLIPTKMDTITGVKMATEIYRLGGIGILPRFDTIEDQAKKVLEVTNSGAKVLAAIGVKDGFLDRARALVKAGAVGIDIDVAHGHMQQTIDAVKTLKNEFKDDITIIAGIASTYECARDLYKAGADSLLVGIGAGSICTTRIQTGCGVPMFTSLIETAKAAKEFGKTFMPDAGIKNSGDIVKALAIGACATVSGFIFAGTDECPGEVFELNGKKYKNYNGSASKAEKINQLKKDSSDKNEKYAVHVEGVEGMVEYRGSLETVVDSLCAGIRSGLSYCGARNINELHEKAEFIRITSGGIRENGAHDVVVKY